MLGIKLKITIENFKDKHDKTNNVQHQKMFIFTIITNGIS